MEMRIFLGGMETDYVLVFKDHLHDSRLWVVSLLDRKGNATSLGLIDKRDIERLADSS